jgi:cytochrome c
MKKLLFAVAAFSFAVCIFFACKSLKPQAITTAQTTRVLVFTKTKGYYHQSIPAGVAAIQKLGRENNFLVDSTSDAAYFIEDSLKNYNAVIFLSTTMNVLNADQQVAFERYIQAGGGFVGIHAATDTEYDWPWYNKLVGAYFASHPKQQKAVVEVKDKSHVSTSFLPEKWERFDEWYNYKNIQPDLKVLATLDEQSYQGGTNGDNHPIAWYHEFDGGRAFYTGGGHTNESYSEPLFLQHILGGIKYAMGSQQLDYAKAYSVKSPEDNRFTKTVLVNDLNEPMELAVAPDGRVFFTERAGKFYVYDPVSKSTKLVRDFPVKAVEKYLNGLIGITLDPDFSKNDYIYFFYSTARGNQYMQRVSRFTISRDNILDTASEKAIIEIPIDLEVSAHTGGSLAWDKYKNLYISTGDNTVPFESDGYAPIDKRAGRQVYDAQRSAGNPNDLRGKVLRIHPEPDGSYTIPEGNLFPKGMAGTRPEIYVMGCRNPYRIAVDTATSFVYWGEVGPDAGRDSRHGPRGYDEFNQAKQAGNFGWPYFVGNNFAYNDSDFATKAIGDLFDVKAPVNHSPNNTGIKNLPPAQGPMIWFPYNRSEEFPDLGEGGRCAMGGPVYHYNPDLKTPTRLPAYYDKAWFIYDWMRNWVFAVRMDEQNNYKRMEPFMGTNGDFRRPIDLEIGPDGVLYMLEYGSVYGIDNEDARLVRIDFNGGNRAPMAKITTKDTLGLAPLKTIITSKGSFDFDEDDQLTYEWTIAGKGVVSSAPNLGYTFENNGIYNVILKVTDPAGENSTDTVAIKVGNTLPLVRINAADNSTFFFDKITGLKYDVQVKDNEDQEIDPKNVKVTLNYIPKVASAQALVGHQQISESYNLGKILMANSDCKACHQVSAKSVGPSFMEVSKKYSSDKNAIGRLANKIITGGGGVWGDHAMNAHPQLSKEDATEIVKYVLSISLQKQEVQLPQQGSTVLNEHAGSSEEGRYLLSASYTDKGGAITPLTSKDVLILRPSKVQAEDADAFFNVQKQDQRIRIINSGAYFMLQNIDLKDVQKLTYRYASVNKNATIAVHIDSVQGQVISTVDYKPTGSWDQYAEISTPVTDPGGKHNLYFVVVKNDTPNNRLGIIDWVRFEGGREVKPEAAPQKSVVKTTTPVSKPPADKAALTARKTEKKTIPTGSILIASSDCKTCHTPNQKLIGPSYQQIAKRYQKTPAVISSLATKIIVGGSGIWGQIPMTPHPKLSKKEATEIVNYILSLR